MGISDWAADAIRGGLVVSCQAPPSHPLRTVPGITALARSAVKGGAWGLRLDGADDVAAVRAVTDLPIIGISKQYRPGGSRPLIAMSETRAAELADAGADILALEVTAERSPHAAAAVIEYIHQQLGLPVMADVSTAHEGEIALGLGADLVATTLAGYTPESAGAPAPDYDLLEELCGLGARAVLEGSVASPEQARAGIDRGAWAVVVGKAITDPLVLTQRFVAALAGERPATSSAARTRPPAAEPPRRGAQRPGGEPA